MSHSSLRFDAASAAELAEAFETVVTLVLELDDEVRSATVDLSMFAAGLAQLSAALGRVQSPLGDDESLTAAEITELGTFGFSLLEGLRDGVAGTGGDALWRCLDQLQIPLALWIVRHGGDWRKWEALTNALAQQANALRDPQTLRRLSDVMGELIEAAPLILRADLVRIDPSRPWRVMHLNRAIVATRAFDVEAMEAAFGALLARLPEDAEAFFNEGIQRAEQMGAPRAVLDCFERYRARTPHPTIH